MNEEENKKAKAEQEELEAQEREEQLNSEAESRGLDEHSMDIGDDSNGEESNEKNKTPKRNKSGEDLNRNSRDTDKTGSDSMPTSDRTRLPNRGGTTGTAESGVGAGETAAGASTGTGATAAGAGEAAAGGAATAGGGTAAGATAATAASIVIPVIISLLIVFAIIGIVGFFVLVPQFLWNRLKELQTSFMTNLEGYWHGMDEVLTKKEDIIYVGQYLYDMGYDLVGMGFAESVKIAGQKDEDGNLVPTDKTHVKNQIVDIDAPFLRAYLVAENRTYLINNYTFNLADFFNNFTFFGIGNGKPEDWGTGLIELEPSIFESIFPKLSRGIGSYRFFGEQSLGELLKGVRIDRASNMMEIKRMNFSSGLAFWNWHQDTAYFNLEGWSGRYGKPFELMLTLHVATMAPDLVNEFANNKDLDAKVHVKLQETTFSGNILVDGKTIEQLEAEGTTDADGNFTPTYDASTISALRDAENSHAKNITTAIPYISSVTNHWFRNVYFEGTSSMGAGRNVDIGIDQDADGLEDYNETSGVKTQKTRKLTAEDSVYGFGKSEAEMEYKESIPGISGKITIKGRFNNAAIQNKDAVRGVTNPTTKKLFGEKYYIYDGTIATAKKIQRARAARDDSIKDKIKFTKDSLQAFTILESSETLDAQFIYRDLKELVIELGYFEREDFDVIEKKVLEWPIPKYIPGEWPIREIEKQINEYGTMIACDETVAYANGLTTDDVRAIAGLDKNKTAKERTYKDTLRRSLFLGDSYFKNLKDANILEDVYIYANDDSTPQYWIDNIATYPEYFGKIIIYAGLNNIEDYQAMENLLDALREKYERKRIYVIELMHLGKNYTGGDADKINAQIDTFNSHVRDKAKTMKDVRFIDASKGFITDGYLTSTSDGKHITDYTQWAKNIADEINDRTTLSSNPTDEKMVLEFLKNARNIAKKLKDEGFSYGKIDFIPAKTDGSTTEKKEKHINNSAFVSWALYESGYRDVGTSGLTVGNNGNFISYCKGKKWKRIEDVADVQAGDIIFTGKLDKEGLKARNVYIYAGQGKLYDVSSDQKIQTDQPLTENIPSDFFCAYRLKGDGIMSTGFEKGLDVIAPANGIIKTIYTDDTNIYTFNNLSTSIDGKQVTKPTDEVPGRQQTYQGLAIKISDKLLKGYTLVMYGFEVEGISEGQEIKVGDKIGTTLDSDICLVLLDRDKAVVEDVEDYFKVPEKKSGGLRILDDYDVTDETNFVYDIADFIYMFEGHKNITDNAQAFMDMQDKYGISAVFAAAVTLTESGGGTGWDLIAPYTHNWVSIKGSYNGSYTDRLGNKWKVYPSFAAAIDDFGNLIANRDKEPGYVKFGNVMVSQIGSVYCPSTDHRKPLGRIN